jgi:hypothetical protein
MKRQSSENKTEDEKYQADMNDETGMPEIREEELDRLSGGGNSAWGTVAPPPAPSPS